MGLVIILLLPTLYGLHGMTASYTKHFIFTISSTTFGRDIQHEMIMVLQKFKLKFFFSKFLLFFLINVACQKPICCEENLFQYFRSMQSHMKYLIVQTFYIVNDWFEISINLNIQLLYFVLTLLEINPS